MVIAKVAVNFHCQCAAVFVAQPPADGRNINAGFNTPGCEKVTEVVVSEAGDIQTVSRWLGHKDGGALAMKVYGHLRDHHSVAMAQKVTFTQVQDQPGAQMHEQ